MQGGGIGDLLAQIRAGIDQHPAMTIGRNGDARLAALRRGTISCAGAQAAGPGGIPLREPATGTGAKHYDPEHAVSPRAAALADLGAGVAVDFERERNLNDLGCLPGHGSFLIPTPAQRRQDGSCRIRWPSSSHVIKAFHCHPTHSQGERSPKLGRSQCPVPGHQPQQAGQAAGAAHTGKDQARADKARQCIKPGRDQAA